MKKPCLQTGKGTELNYDKPVYEQVTTLKHGIDKSVCRQIKGLRYVKPVWK